MRLEEVIENISELSGDPLAIGFRGPGDSTASFVWTNSHFLELFGYTSEEILGQPVELQHDPETADQLTRSVRQQLETVGRARDEVQCLRKDGSRFWVSLTVVPQVASDRDGRYTIGIYRDIDALKSREQAAERALSEREVILAELQGAQDRLITAINTIRDPFAIYDRNNALVLWNRAYAESTTSDPDALKAGMSVEDVLRLAISSGRFREAQDGAEAWLESKRRDWIDNRGVVKMLIDGRHFQVYRSVVPNGDTVVLRVDVTDLYEQGERLKAYASKLEEANRQIEYKATHDELTGLGNRRYLEERLEAARVRRREEGLEIAVLHIDLDRFKQINDTMGHKAGDHVLREVAARLRQVLRPEDAIARVGGDEFVAVLCCENGSTIPDTVAQRIVKSMSVPVNHEGKSCRVGASIGISQTPFSDEHELLITSDVALYEAKGRGRSCTATFDMSLLREMQEHKRLADDILRGLEAGEFVPFYQPQIEARTSRLVGLEALARWRHPSRGILEPAAFLHVAEDLDVVRDIDRAILEQAIAECSTQFDGLERPPKLGFNVSARRIHDLSVDQLAVTLARYPGTVAFELLESILMEDETEEFWFRLDALKEIGVEIEMDDFGSGRASLVALTKVAPQRLKIDRRLIAPIVHSAEALDMVRAIVDIGHSLRIGIIAEGVETPAHVEMLRDLGCETLQGFHFSRPAPLAELSRFFPRGADGGAQAAGQTPG